MNDLIITTLLDTDFYKFTMSQFIHKYYPEAKATFRLINRSGEPETKYVKVDALKEQLEYISKLRFSEYDGEILTEISPRTFSHQFKFDLTKINLPMPLVEKDSRTGRLKVEVTGLWWQVTFWETYIMSVISELWNQAQGGTTATGIRNLHSKIRVLENSNLNVIDFGTRRRASLEWHRRVLREGIPWIKGTSNVALARSFDIPVVGTMAHEIFMGVAALYSHADSSLRGSQQITLSQWYKLYGDTLTIALTDTWTSEFFFKDFTRPQAETWKGLRQDSGDPIKFAQLALSFYKHYLVNPKSKTIVFSDGLTLPTILLLDHYWKDKFNLVYGWGTNLTNDMGLPCLQPVVKLVSLNCNSTVKLSDEIGKWIGPSEELSRYGRVFRI